MVSLIGIRQPLKGIELLVPKDDSELSILVIEPYKEVIKEKPRILAKAVADAYAYFYDTDWHRRLLLRICKIPFKSSYETDQWDMNVWLVVGSPTRGLILIGEWKEALGIPCWIIDFLSGRLVNLWISSKAEASNVELRQLTPKKDKDERKWAYAVC